jgi:hypothetical protein
LKNQIVKLGQKSTGTQKAKHGIYRKKQKFNLACLPSGQGAGQEWLIFTPLLPCPSIQKRHTNSGASTAHVLQKNKSKAPCFLAPPLFAVKK